MTPLQLVADNFDDHTMERGREYFDRGAVEIVRSDEESISANVTGTRRYRVSINLYPDDIEGECTCPYFEQHGPCKHIWATLLAAEDRGLLALPEDSEFDDDDPPVVIDFGAWSNGETPARRTKSANGGGKQPPWKHHLRSISNLAMEQGFALVKLPWPAQRQLVYLLEPMPHARREPGLILELGSRTLEPSGPSDRAKKLKMTAAQIASLPDPDDRLILQLITGLDQEYSYYGSYDRPIQTRYVIRHGDAELLLRRLCATRRCYIKSSDNRLTDAPLEWDDGAAWQLWLELQPDETAERYSLSASLRRDAQRIDATTPAIVLPVGIMIHQGRVSRFEDGGAFHFLDYLRGDQRVSLAVQQGDDLLAELLAMSPLPRLDLPPQMQVTEIRPALRPRLKIKAPGPRSGSDRLLARLTFDYAGSLVEEGERASAFDRDRRTLLIRDIVAERAAAALLDELGCKFQYGYRPSDNGRLIHPQKLGRIVSQLCSAGWHVEAEGKLYRNPGQFKINVRSGIDWFELDGKVDFDGVGTSLPALLDALRKGEKTVRLDDGSIGVLPEQWLSRYGLLARLSETDGESVKFSRGQVGLLDALLAEMPDATFDASFEAARRELLQFHGVDAVETPPGFQGQLRPYQQQGLGWLGFLQRFGFGGCLADDMGLGKTVQVLALLESRRGGARPSLVVVPRSLVFNWIEEARRFTPQLRVLDHTGVQRAKSVDAFKDHDIILTTYGTLRLDAPLLRDFRFDCAILDEAQAIKNSSSASAKAARLIRADHRLVLSGTPVQNHLGELWSLFEFLNPGMLGTASVFKGVGGGNGIDQAGRELLSRALRPFILRRTKEQVAPDLPAKTEQTLYCDLEPEHRKQYDELRDHYRVSLLDRIATEGMNKAKIQILEALLRLRQAACHPGLIDKSRCDESSAKLDALLPQLAEVIDEGHKVLVFSQFTSMLAIVKRHLDKQGITYEYLDGKTRDRQARVDRFQNDPQCRLFLVSLKAGGLGLNLTAAEYVFLLDPWWNPAIESQAIDRAHRIGQTRHVFAYRIIARDTVEQKVLDLQARKKDLADMIINADNSLIGKLGREDLELLLS